MAPNPITFQDIVAYHSMYEFDDFDEFQTLICQMDDKWMSIMAERKTK